jgi:two-component system OmpR family response regulator
MPYTPAPSASSDIAGGLRVLVVDDHMDAAEALGILLEVFGHEVKTSFDGQQALDTIVAWEPDLVLMDLSLPVIDGYEAGQRVQAHAAANPGFAVPYMAALSGFSGDAERQRTAACGYARHLVKPVGPDQLKAVIAEAGRFRQTAVPGGTDLANG